MSRDADAAPSGPGSRGSAASAPPGSGPGRAALPSLPILLGCGALSGALLFLSDHPLRAWPLQAVALVPFLWALGRHAGSTRAAALGALCLGLGSMLPLAVVLEFPAHMAAGLGIYLTLIWVAFAVGARLVMRWPGALGGLAVGAVGVLVEWVDFSLVPVWGTAQCFARTWSAAPHLIQFVDLVGMLGLVFVLVSGQALLVKLLVEPGCRRSSAAALLGLLVLVGLYDAWAWRRPASSALRVAAIGWTHRDLPRGFATPSRTMLEKVHGPLIARAAAAGARLVVTPEVGLSLGAELRAELLDALGGIARRHELWLAVGYFDRQRNDNRIAFLDERGLLRAEYRKTHLIPFVEGYQAGVGETVLLDGPRATGGSPPTSPSGRASPGAAPVRLGGMICQDDNFTDLARAYGRLRAQIVAVPTNDWEQVMRFHLENSLFRPLESRYAVVRAASNGLSAIVSPRGEVLAQANHFDEGPKMIVADVPLGEGGSIYSRAGDLPLLSVALLLLGGGALGTRRRGRAGAPR